MTSCFPRSIETRVPDALNRTDCRKNAAAMANLGATADISTNRVGASGRSRQPFGRFGGLHRHIA